MSQKMHKYNFLSNEIFLTFLKIHWIKVEQVLKTDYKVEKL